MGTPPTFVVVGASLAGAKTVEALREDGFGGRVVLIGDEPERPYERPPLSKDYLQGRSEREKLFVHPPRWYAEHDVDLRLGQRVSAVDVSAHRVSIDDGTSVGYDRLLLATGSSPLRLPVPGAELEGVLYLRRVDDADRLRVALKSGSRVAIVGAGWIGLEVAAAACAAGACVTVLERSELPLLRVLGRECAEIFAALHAEHGVDMRFGVSVAEVVGTSGRASGVRLHDGTQIDADAVVVGVGITPNTQLAQAAGIAVDDGVTVDEHLGTSAGDVFAAGDVAKAFHPLLGKHIRVEHWSSALNQPKVAAASMLGRTAVYDRIPYFFSDQYDLGMEYSGCVEPGGYDEVVFRGDVTSREFIAFWVRDGRVLAGMNVNVWDATADIQALVRTGARVDATKLADTDVTLDAVLDDRPRTS